MSATPPPGYTPPPTDLPQRGDRATFSNRVDAWVTWFSTVILTQLAAMIANAYANALDAFASAASALGAKTAAETARDAAQGYRDAAAASATAASGSATAASGSAAAAAASAASAAALAGAFVGTSTSSITIGAGNKTFTTQAGEQYTPGIFMTAVSNANGANWMGGQVVSYSGTSLVLNVTVTGGSGTFNDWNLSLAGIPGATGPQGPAGSLNGGQLTGALDWAKGADVASATTPDIWSGAGNYEVLTGTVPVTGFTAAPQAGANRRLLAGGATPLVAGANLIVKGMVSGQTYTCTPGDEIDVYAETTTKFRLTVSKGDGTAMAGLYGAYQNSLRFTSSGTFVARKTGWHRITIAGSSGRGGIARDNATSLAKATGAGAGGFSVGMKFLIAGQSYTVTVGAAPAGATRSTNGATAGVAGNASSFSGSGILTMTANGGGAGQAAVTSGALTGGQGGTATGGDINVTGGNGGDIAANGAYCASGGGSVGIQGAGFRGGNITPGNSAGSRASGGAGVGGNGGDITGTANAESGGGGAGGSAPASTTTGGTGGANFSGAAGLTVATFGEAYVLANATGGGSTGGSTAFVAGGGGAGIVDNNTNGAGGAFAGGGGSASATTDATGGAGGAFGGAPGGAAGAGSGSTVSGTASAGFAQIEF